MPLMIVAVPMKLSAYHLHSIMLNRVIIITRFGSYLIRYFHNRVKRLKLVMRINQF